MQAIWNNKIIAESPREYLIYIEGNWYFPPDSVKKEFLRESSTPYTCPWKGVCLYFDVGEGETWNQDVAWTYQAPLQSAIDRVKKNFSNYIAFQREVSVTE